MTKLAILSLAAALGAAAVPLLAQPPADANRDAFYCDERKLGSWFYCNSEEAKRKARIASHSCDRAHGSDYGAAG